MDRTTTTGLKFLRVDLINVGGKRYPACRVLSFCLRGRGIALPGSRGAYAAGKSSHSYRKSINRPLSLLRIDLFLKYLLSSPSSPRPSSARLQSRPFFDASAPGLHVLLSAPPESSRLW